MVYCGSVWVILSISLLVVLLFRFCSMILCVCHFLYQGCSRSVPVLHVCFFPVSGCSVLDPCLWVFCHVFPSFGLGQNQFPSSSSPTPDLRTLPLDNSAQYQTWVQASCYHTLGASKPREVDSSDELVLLLRQVYEQAFTKFTSLRVYKEFQRFRVNACIDFTKGKNKLINYCTELVDYIFKGKSKYNYCLRIEKGRRQSQVRDKGTWGINESEIREWGEASWKV